MYEIRPECLKTFVEDTSIKLPRFQRKQTWDDKKNFELCISIFKEYPMGVCILNLEKVNGRETKWLLDGRQRRNAFSRIWNDPEQIYLWAKKWISIKNNDQIADLEEKFWLKISDYLEEDAFEEESIEVTTELKIEKETNIVYEEEYLSESNLDDEYDQTKNESYGLEFLLDIIKLIHNKNSFCSGLTRTFDFSKIVSNLPYVVNDANGKKQLSSKKWKSFILEYESYCRNEEKDLECEDSFKKFMFGRFEFSPGNKEKLNKQIKQDWNSIKKRINIINKIRDILISSKIGLIEVKDIAPTDAQKIFNIINSKGTKLNAVEVLSAKPSWNVKMKNPNSSQIETTKNLYEKIGVKYNDVVKWDIPATFISRLSNTSFLFKDFSENKTGFEKQLTLGFKILSGIYTKGVKKDDIDLLSKNASINWDADIEKTIVEVNTFSKVILSNGYFKYFNSWSGSLMKILSDAIAINFTLIMYEDWKRKDKPVGNDVKSKMFQKNSFILLDSLIYEYVNRQWRGSSDSKIAKNLAEFPKEPEIFNHIDTNKWINLLEEIFSANSIDSEKISIKIMTPILYHFYCISNIQGPGRDSIEVDHIIPQAIFKQSALKDKDYLQHNLFNLALLPKSDNCSKSKKRLVEISDQWLKDQVLKYAFIEQNDYIKFSDLNNIDELKSLRSAIIIEAFDNKRSKILNN